MKDFVVVWKNRYAGFHSTNIKHPVYGIKKGESPVDCARMLAEEYGKDNITVAADIKEIYKYGIQFRDLKDTDKIYINKLNTLIDKTYTQDMETLRKASNAKEQDR